MQSFLPAGKHPNLEQWMEASVLSRPTNNFLKTITKPSLSRIAIDSFFATCLREQDLPQL